MPTKYTRSDIEAFLARGRLGYQEIDLPYGLKTPGHPRDQAKRVALPDDMSGLSVLDIGSYLGAMCIESLRRGADHAVGLELDRQKLISAQQIARFLSLAPTYLRADAETFDLDGKTFDIVLALNVLHHMKDPISLLRRLSFAAQDRLVIEVATLGAHDARRFGLSRRDRRTLERLPSVLVGPHDPKFHIQQTYYFSEQSLHSILAQHMNVFWRVKTLKSEFKNRFMIRADRLKIDRLIVVAGVNSSGKSWLCDRIRDENFRSPFSARRLGTAPLVSMSTILRSRLDELFPRQDNSDVLFHYDISQIDRYKLYSHDRDPSLDVLDCAVSTDIVTVVPQHATLLSQMHASEIGSRSGTRSLYHEELYDSYRDPSNVGRAYMGWFTSIMDRFPGAANLTYIENEAGDRTFEVVEDLHHAQSIVEQHFGSVA